MLSKEDNDLLTLTNPGTPMGALFRRFWLPVMLSQELPQPDGPPARVRVMGEDFVAFRDTKGRVALIDPHCPHRGANLFFGRNEDCGIRCVYHGWKFDVNGECVEAPALKDAGNYDALRARARLKTCPVREAGEIIWAYLGPEGTAPAFPHMEFCDVPDAQRFVSKKLQQCNWAQASEGAFDTAHFSFLHNSVGDADDMEVMSQSEAAASGDKRRVYWLRKDGAPRFTVVEHPAGLVMGAARRFDGEDLYWRVSQFLMPSHALAPSTFPGEHYHGQTFVPIDETSCWIYCYTWNPGRALTNAERDRFAGGHTVHASVDKNWVPHRNRDNDYLIDRMDQRLRSFTGIKGVSEQDAAVQDSQGFIADRTKELLGPTDFGVVRFRRMILDAAKALQNGTAPVQATQSEGYYVRAGGTVAHKSKTLTEIMMTRFGDPNGAVKEGYQ